MTRRSEVIPLLPRGRETQSDQRLKTMTTSTPSSPAADHDVIEAELTQEDGSSRTPAAWRSSVAGAGTPKSLPLQPVVGLTHLGGAMPSSSTLTPRGVVLELVRRGATPCLAWSVAAGAQDATLCSSCSKLLLQGARFWLPTRRLSACRGSYTPGNSTPHATKREGPVQGEVSAPAKRVPSSTKPPTAPASSESTSASSKFGGASFPSSGKAVRPWPTPASRA